MSAYPKYKTGWPTTKPTYSPYKNSNSTKTNSRPPPYK